MDGAVERLRRKLGKPPEQVELAYGGGFSSAVLGEVDEEPIEVIRDVFVDDEGWPEEDLDAFAIPSDLESLMHAVIQGMLDDDSAAAGGAASTILADPRAATVFPEDVLDMLDAVVDGRMSMSREGDLLVRFTADGPLVKFSREAMLPLLGSTSHPTSGG